MIRNNSITYGAFESPLLTWRVGDPLLDSFLLALLTTILSYQLTAILFDVLVGCKARGKAFVTDLTSVILANESSLLAAAANIFQNSRLWQWRFKAQTLDNSKLDLKKAVIKFPVRLKFCILFCIAPLLHFVAIAVSLERDSILTFEDAKFGGIALGFTGNNSLLFKKENNECIRYQVSHAEREVAIASFHLCSLALIGPPIASNTTTFSASKTPKEEILVLLQGPGGRFGMFMRADLRVSGQIYRLRVGVSPEEQGELIRLGYSILAEACQNQLTPQPAVITSTESMWNISKIVPCTPPLPVVENALDSFRRSISVVDADNFGLIPLSELKVGDALSPNLTGSRPKFIQGSNLAFLRRRKSLVSFAVLCIVTACAVLFRILITFLTNNDIDDGIESIVKFSAREEYCDYVLQN